MPLRYVPYFHYVTLNKYVLYNEAIHMVHTHREKNLDL